jgi:raffinose/stachyose/melibiose transport system permease protein
MMGKKQSAARWVASIVLGLYCLIAIVLIGNIILSSFKTPGELQRNTFGFPRHFSLDNYRQVIGEDSFLKYFLNSIVLTLLSIVSLVFFSSMTAYGIAHYRFRGRNLLEFYFLLGLIFPIQIAILPLFIIMRKFGLVNNYLGMIILYTANMSFSLFVFAQFFRQLPQALHESAVIDGAGEFRIYAQIMMPISRPVIFTVGIISFVQVWNDFYMPLVFLTKRGLFTLTLAIYRYLANFLSYWHYVFAAATIALVPVIIVFFIFSEQIISGLVAGSIKE